MKEYQNMKVIAVDHGYGNIKTANTVTPTGVTGYDAMPIFEDGVLEYEGKFYRIGEGHKEFVADKALDEDYYLLTLMAVAREMNIAGIQDATVHLTAGLPLTWVRTQREEFREYLLQKAEVRFRWNKKEYRVRFAGCSLFPQGYPAIVGKLGELTGTNILADIGNGTMNIMYINNKKPIESKCWTEKFGVNQCMIQAKNALLDKFGIKVEESIVEQVLRTGTADIGKPYLDCICGVAARYTEGIFTALRRYEYNKNLMRLYIVGGGGCLIKHFGHYEQSRVTILDDICATAKGYEYLSFAALRCKEGQNHE